MLILLSMYKIHFKICHCVLFVNVFATGLHKAKFAFKALLVISNCVAIYVCLVFLLCCLQNNKASYVASNTGLFLVIY